MKRIIHLTACAALLTVSCADGAPEAAEASRDEQVTAQQQVTTTPAGKLSTPISGRYADAPFTAVLTISRFVVENGAVFAVGSLSGISGVPASAAQVLAEQVVRIPVGVTRPNGADAGSAADGGAAGCDVLNLLLQPLKLDLLGAVVDLDRVVLDITAVPGPGKLLGNLLCAVTGLLDRGGLLSGLTGGLLDQVVGILNGLTGGLTGSLLDGGAPVRLP